MGILRDLPPTHRLSAPQVWLDVARSRPLDRKYRGSDCDEIQRQSDSGTWERLCRDAEASMSTSF